MTVVWALVIVVVLVVGLGLLLAFIGVGPWRFGWQREDEIRRAAEEDVAAVREDDRYFKRDGPGANLDDL